MKKTMVVPGAALYPPKVVTKVPHIRLLNGVTAP